MHLAQWIRAKKPERHAALTAGNVRENAVESQATGDHRSLLQDIPHTTSVELGQIHYRIAEMIAADGADLLLLASGCVDGPTVERVLHTTRCPVLMVGAGGGARPCDASVIALATDFGPGAAQAASFARSLARRGHGHVHLVHVLPKPAADYAACLSDVHAAEEKLLTLARDHAITSESVHTIVRFGDAAEGILATARQVGADLLILDLPKPAQQASSRWESVQRVLSSASCPVLALPLVTAAAEHPVPAQRDRSAEVPIPANGESHPRESTHVPVSLGRS